MQLDKRTGYFKYVEILSDVKSKEISLMELQALVATYMSSNPKTIEQHIRAMGITGLIKDIGNSRFEINHGNLQ